MTKRLLILVLSLATASTAHCVNRYWCRASCSTANFNCNDAGPLTNWGSASNTCDNSSVPGLNDVAIFDGVGSGAADATISAGINLKGLIMTGYNNTLTHNSGVTLSILGTTTFSTGMTYTLGNAHTSAFSIASTNGAASIAQFTFNGKTLGDISITGGDTNTFMDDVICGTITLGSGGGVARLTLNNSNVTATALFSNASNMSTKILSLGNGTITLNGTGRVWGTFGTVFSSGSTIIVSDTSAAKKDFRSNNFTYNIVTISGDNVLLSTGTPTITTLNVNTAGLTNGVLISTDGTKTITNLATNGSSGSLAKMVSSLSGTAATLSDASGMICVDYMSVQDITGTGGATFNMGGHSTNVSGNTGLNFVACPTGCAPPFCGIIGGS